VKWCARKFRGFTTPQPAAIRLWPQTNVTFSWGVSNGNARPTLQRVLARYLQKTGTASLASADTCLGGASESSNCILGTRGLGVERLRYNTTADASRAPPPPFFVMTRNQELAKRQTDVLLCDPHAYMHTKESEGELEKCKRTHRQPPGCAAVKNAARSRCDDCAMASQGAPEIFKPRLG